MTLSPTTEGVLHDCPRASSSVDRRRAFTLIELLVVIGIIALLISILLPVVSKVRIASQKAATQSWINQLGSAIERYQQDFKAYPGPFGNNDVYYTNFNGGAFTSGITTVAASGFDTTTALNPKKITMAENLVLGLLGGIHVDTTTNTQLDYDPSAIGGGPVSLNTIGLPKRYPPYMDNTQLSWTTNSNGMTGHFQDESGSADDTIIPVFTDRFNNPMPILYMRAKLGANPAAGAVPSATPYGDVYNPIVTDDLSETMAPLAVSTPQAYAVRAGQYDISQIQAYTGVFSGTSIGIGKSPTLSKYTSPPAGGNAYHGLQMKPWTGTAYPTMTSQYPYDAYPYLIGSSGTAREKDGYILISAGADRVYGTEDDICNFGDVNP